MSNAKNDVSLAFELYMFFMNSKTGLGLSTATLKVLDILAHRIGRNKVTWIKQITLAAHLRIDLKSLQKHLKKLQQCNVIEAQSMAENCPTNVKKDARKSMYSINEKFYGYSEKSLEEKIKVHISFNDEYMTVDERVKELEQKEKSYRNKSLAKTKSEQTLEQDEVQKYPVISEDQNITGQKYPVIIQDTGQKYPVNTGQKYPVIFDQEFSGDPANPALNEGHQIPKESPQRFKLVKDSFYCSSGDEPHINDGFNLTVVEQKQTNTKIDWKEGFDDFWAIYPRKVARKKAMQAWVNNKCRNHLANILHDIPKRIEMEWRHKEKEFIPHASTYLNQERWNDEIIEVKGKKTVADVKTSKYEIKQEAAMKEVQDTQAEIRRLMEIKRQREMEKQKFGETCHGYID